MRRDDAGELEIYAPGMSASSQTEDKATGLKAPSLSLTQQVQSCFFHGNMKLHQKKALIFQCQKRFLKDLTDLAEDAEVVSTGFPQLP